MQAVKWKIAVLLLVLAGCVRGTPFTLEQYQRTSIPGLEQSVFVVAGDVHYTGHVDLRIVGSHDELLTEKLDAVRGDKLPFDFGNTKHVVEVISFDTHLTKTDYVHLTVYTEP